MAYSAKNAVGPTGMGGNNPLSGEQVAQGVVNPTANAIQVAQVDSSGNPITAANPLPVNGTLTIVDPTATYTDGSGTFTSGGTSQQIFAANATRQYLFVCNTSDTVMYLNFGTAAVAGQPSITLIPNGGFFEPLIAPGQTVNLLCATTGKTFVAKQA